MSIGRRRFAAVAGAVAAVALLVVLALLVAVHPGAVALASAVAALLAVSSKHAIAIARAVACVAVLAALALAAAVWPVTTGLAAVVAAIVALAWWAPAWALAGGVLLFGFEGSVKVLLGLEPTPLPFGNRELGAAAIDLALFAGVAGVLVADRGRSLRELWAATHRGERIVLGLLAAWFAVSILQIAQGGDLERGLHGFRLFQAYVLVGLAAAVVFRRPAAAVPAAQVVLWIGLIVSAYAAFRVLIGPADAEEAFAVSVETVTRYDGNFRAIGSFSGAVGMGSFLLPMAVFAVVVGFLIPRLRVLGWLVASLAMVGIVASYGRTVFLGMALGLLCLVVIIGSGATARQRLAALGLLVAVLALSYGGVQIAAQASPRLEERAEGIFDPFDDASIRLRFDTWEDRLDEAVNRPLGRGIGSAGAASTAVRGTREDLVTTDNSFLKVLLEQGIPVTAVFLATLLGVVALAGRRLMALQREGRRAVGVAALCAFVAFLGLALLGEAVEQPGKVLAWGFLGIALAQALGGDRARA